MKRTKPKARIMPIQPPAQTEHRLPARLLERLMRLDPEQLQVIELCAIAIAGGAR